MLHSLRTAAHRRVVLIASGTAVVLAVGGGATAALAATPTPAASTPAASTATCQPHLRALLRGAAPAALERDLHALRSAPEGAARRAERKEIRQKALAGAYGARIARIAHIVAGQKAGTSVRASLPAALKADLKALRATTPRSAARKAAALRIEQKALAGGYGTVVQKRAQAVQKRVQAHCSAKG